MEGLRFCGPQSGPANVGRNRFIAPFAGGARRNALPLIAPYSQHPFFLVSSIASSSVEAVTTVFTSSPLSSMMQLTR